MSDFLSTFLDPYEEAKLRAEKGDKAGALHTLQPLLAEIKASGGEPSPQLQVLLEDLVLHDAATHGVTA